MLLSVAIDKKVRKSDLQAVSVGTDDGGHWADVVRSSSRHGTSLTYYPGVLNFCWYVWTTSWNWHRVFCCCSSWCSGHCVRLGFWFNLRLNHCKSTKCSYSNLYIELDSIDRVVSGCTYLYIELDSIGWGCIRMLSILLKIPQAGTSLEHNRLYIEHWYNCQC